MLHPVRKPGTQRIDERVLRFAYLRLRRSMTDETKFGVAFVKKFVCAREGI